MNSRQYREMQRELLLSWVAVFCLLLAGVGVFFGAKLYHRWTVHRQMVSAKTSRQSGDLNAEIATLAKVVQAKPDHLIAIRMLAEALEQVHSPEAISFREKAIGVAPDSIEDLFHLLDASLVFENVSKAEMALGLLRKNPQLLPAALHPYLARLALLNGDPKTAAAEYAECLRLEPKNTSYILAAASLQAGDGNSENREAARAVLQRYQADPQYRIAALRGLVQAGIRDAIEKRDAFTAYSLADDLVMNKNATFDDRLLRLTLLRETKDSFRDSYLTQLENESQKSFASLNAMVKWIVAHQAAAQCTAWLEALPARLLKKPPLAKSTVEAFLQEEKWEKAVEITLGEDWEDLDWMRLAYLSIAQAGSGRATLSATTWRKSVESAQNDLGSLTTLLDLATKQNWPDQRVDLLWELSEISSEPEPILTTLLAEHLQHRDTARAYRACSRLIETHSATLQNQWARLALLQGENTEKALAFVRAQHLENPDALDARLVLAMGYLRERRFAEAYFLLRQLPADQLQEPRAATYFGIASAWLGMIDAGRYLNLGIQADLFPEETAMVRQARRAIQQDWLSDENAPGIPMQPASFPVYF